MPVRLGARILSEVERGCVVRDQPPVPGVAATGLRPAVFQFTRMVQKMSQL